MHYFIACLLLVTCAYDVTRGLPLSTHVIFERTINLLARLEDHSVHATSALCSADVGACAETASALCNLADPHVALTLYQPPEPARTQRHLVVQLYTFYAPLITALDGIVERHQTSGLCAPNLVSTSVAFCRKVELMRKKLKEDLVPALERALLHYGEEVPHPRAAVLAQDTTLCDYALLNLLSERTQALTAIMIKNRTFMI